jgi:hypothetical protein
MFESGVACDVPVGSLLGALVGGPSFCDMEADRCTGGTEVSSSAVGIGTGLFGAAAALSLKSSLGLGLASGFHMCYWPAKVRWRGTIIDHFFDNDWALFTIFRKRSIVDFGASKGTAAA